MIIAIVVLSMVVILLEIAATLYEYSLDEEIYKLQVARFTKSD